LARSGFSQITALLTANAFSMVGNSLSAIAIPWFVYKLTGNAVMTASVVLVGQLPNIVIGLFGGVFIDRFGAKKVSLFSDGVNFFAILCIPFFYSVDLLNVFLLALLVFFSQVVDVPGSSARNVLIPAIIDQFKLPRTRINGLNSLIETGADLIGPVIASLLLLLTSELHLLIIDSVTFLLSFFIILIFIPSTNRNSQSEKSLISITESLRWLKKDKWVLRLALFDALINMAATPLLALTLPIMAQAENSNAGWLGYWLVCFASGTTLTTAAYTWVGHRLSNTLLLKLTPIGQGFGMSFLVLSTWLDLSGIWVGVGLFIYGVNLGVGSMVDAMVLQTRVPQEQRGRLFSVFESVRYIGVPVGLLISGLVIEYSQMWVLITLFILFVITASSLWWRISETELVVQ